MADSIRALRVRYQEWKKKPTDENWKRFFQNMDRGTVEYAFSVEKTYSNIGIVDTDTLIEVVEKSNSHLEAQKRDLEAQIRDLKETGRNMFLQGTEELVITDWKFDPDYVGSQWDDPDYHLSRLHEIGACLALGVKTTIPPKASAYLSRALLRIWDGSPAEEALRIKKTKKPSQARRNESMTIDYLRLRERGMNAKMSLAKIMEEWGIKRPSTVKDIVRRNKNTVLSALENNKRFAKERGWDWDEYVDSFRPRAEIECSYDVLTEMRTRYLEDKSH